MDTVSEPYLALSGTSMAAPVVTGTIALMFEANPRLTPNLVKAILQYTAENRPQYDHSAEGAGFLNARGAVQLARSLAPDAAPAAGPADPTRWSRQILWGNQRITGSVLKADSAAWRLGVTWGASATGSGDPVEWGRDEAAAADALRAACDAGSCPGRTWTADVPGLVLGAACATLDCGAAAANRGPAVPALTRSRDGWLARVLR